MPEIGTQEHPKAAIITIDDNIKHRLFELQRMLSRIESALFSVPGSGQDQESKKNPGYPSGFFNELRVRLSENRNVLSEIQEIVRRISNQVILPTPEVDSNPR